MNSKITQIVLLILIIIGIGLLFTQKKWVPHLVQFILAHEDRSTNPEPVNETEKNFQTLSNLHLGQTATALGVTLTPRHVFEDSRCPKDVQCIQAGKVQVAAELTSASGKAAFQVFEINMPITTEAEIVTLTSVLPEKRSTHKITDQEYVFSFEIKKR